MGMKASAKKAYGSESLQGKHVLVQGAGHVGGYLVDHLVKDGAHVMIADIFENKIKEVTNRHPKVEVVSAENVSALEMDIYAPCALGATLNDDTIPQLKCQIVAGAANNQLAEEKKHGKMMIERGIIYAPDFLINAGGLINCYSELEGYNRERALQQAENIYETTMTVLDSSQASGKPTYQIANEMAEQRIESIAQIHRSL